VLQLQPYMEDWYGRGLDVVLIAADREKQLADFIAKHDLRVEVLLDSKREVSRLYQVQGIPVTVYLDREGVVRHSSIGWEPASLESTLQLAEQLLN
jgi:peroxiredoxin